MNDNSDYLVPQLVVSPTVAMRAAEWMSNYLANILIAVV
jgi:hypothetical protein